MLKIKLDPFLGMVLIALGCIVPALPVLLWTGFPRVESWSWLAGSVVIHVLYYIALAEAYRFGDMGLVYPVARGSAPLLTAVTGIFLLGEPVTAIGFLGILVLTSGIFVMALKKASATAHLDGKALGFAGLTAGLICLYTICDGQGARAAADPIAYVSALFVIEGIVFFGFALWRRGVEGLRLIKPFLGMGLAGGTMSAGAYGIAIWAMTIAPIPLVAAVRETSVLFGAVIAVVILKEPLRINRIVAAVMIMMGLVLIRLQ